MRQTFRYWLIVVMALMGSAAAAQERQNDYQLGPGDNIRIVVFRNPDLTLENARIGKRFDYLSIDWCCGSGWADDRCSRIKDCQSAEKRAVF